MIEICRQINKKWLVFITLIFACCLLFAVGSGCSCANVFKETEITNYLHDKYGEDFAFIRNGDESWNSSYSLWRYANSAGEEFYVRVDKNSNELSDNYASIVFDNDVAKYISTLLQNKYVVTLSSTTHYTAKEEVFSSPKDYIESLDVCSVSVFTDTDWGSYFSDIEKLKNLTTNKCVVYVAQLDSENMAKIKNDSSSNISSGKIKSCTYIIENQNIKIKEG